MVKFFTKRILCLLLVVWIVSVLAFVMMRLAPGDAAVMALPDYASEAQIEAMRAKLGLDKPYITQYLMYLGNLLKGDLGTSVLYEKPCLDVIMDSECYYRVLSTGTDHQYSVGNHCRRQ